MPSEALDLTPRLLTFLFLLIVRPLLQELKTEARRCQTPKQFRELLKHLQAFIPYSKFAGSWGYPSRTTIRFIFNQGFSRDLIRWRLTTGALWTSPLFQEWLRTKRTILWCDAVKHLKAQFDPELLRRMKQAGAQYALCGGFASPDYYVLFAAAMPSAASGRAHLKQFGQLFRCWSRRASVRIHAHCSRSARRLCLSVAQWERLPNRLGWPKGSVSVRSESTSSASKRSSIPMIS